MAQIIFCQVPDLGKSLFQIVLLGFESRLSSPRLLFLHPPLEPQLPLPSGWEGRRPAPQFRHPSCQRLLELHCLPCRVASGASS